MLHQVRRGRRHAPAQAGFAPTLLPGCQAWFRADQGLSLSGTSLLSWTDLVSGLVLAPATTSPTYVPSIFSAQPAIEFTSSGGQTLSTALGPTIAQPNSMFLVVQSTNAAPAQNALVVDGTTAANAQSFGQASGSAVSVSLNAGTAETAAVSSIVTNPTVLQVDWNAASSVVYQNGSAIAVTGTVGTQPITFGAIGGPLGSPAGVQFQGYVAEVVLYNRQLNANERVLVTRYLGHRYGVNVP